MLVIQLKLEQNLEQNKAKIVKIDALEAKLQRFETFFDTSKGLLVFRLTN